MKIEKDTLLGILILVGIVFLCLMSTFTEYRMYESIEKFNRSSRNFYDFQDSIFAESNKREKIKREYITRLLEKDKEVIIHLDSLKSNIIPDTIFSMKTLKMLKIIPSSKKTNDSEIKFQLKSVPSKIWRLKNLERLDFMGNRIEKIPATISGLENLSELILLDHNLNEDEIRLLENRVNEKCKLIIY